MIASAPPAHPQNTGQRNGSVMPSQEYAVPPISAKPISSRILLTFEEIFEKIYCLFVAEYRGQVSASDANCSSYGNGICDFQKPPEPRIILWSAGRRTNHNWILYFQKPKEAT